MSMAQTATVEESHERRAQAARFGEIERFCACGCGEIFIPRRRNQKYFDSAKCRERVRQGKSELIRVPIEEVREIKAGIAHRKAKRSVVPRISGTEGYESMVSRRTIFLVASWLKNRLLAEQRK